MFLRISLKFIKKQFVILIVIWLFSCLTFANYSSKKSAIELENEAKQFAQIWNGDEIRRSILLFTQASDKWSKIGELQYASFCLRESARLSTLISDHNNASRALKKALYFDRKIKNIEGQVFSHSLFSQLEIQRGGIQKSESHYKKAIELSRSSTNKAKAFAFFTAGKHSLEFININVALEFFDKAKNFSKETEYPDLTAQIFLNRGIVQTIKGNKNVGLSDIRTAEEIWEKGGNKRGIALVYNSLAFAYVITNEKQKALEFYKKAEKMIPEGVDFNERSKIYSGIASINLDYKKLPFAEQNFREALKYQEKAQNILGQLTILPELARINYLIGDKKSGEEFFERALDLGKNIESKFILANTTEIMGLVEFDEENFDEAITKFKIAHRLYDEVGVEIPRIHTRIGLAYEKKGELKTAREYYISSLNKNRETKDVVQTAENLYNLARLSKIKGNIEKALEESEESLSLSELIYNDVGNNSLRSSYLSNVFERYELNIHLLMKMHERFPDKGFDAMAFLASEKSRTRLMLERLKLSEADFTRDADPELVEKEMELLNLLSIKSNNLTHLLSVNAPKEKINNLTFEIKEIENQLEHVKAELKKESPIYSEIKSPRAFDINEFQQNVLDEKTVLLEFSLGDEESYLWMIGKNKFKVVKLPKREIIEEKIDKILKLLIRRDKFPQEEIEDYQKRLINAEIEFLNGAQDLSNDLFGQLINEISEKRLIIVPDGKLQYFPISALPLPGEFGNSKINEPFLLENEIIYEPSASLLNLLKKLTLISNKPTKEMLIFADPVFSENDNRFNTTSIKNSNQQNLRIENNLSPTSSPDSLKRLLASNEESKSILQSFGIKNTTVVSDFAANREVFLNSDLKDYQIIHFATHGFIDEERPELSGIVLSLYDEQAIKRDGFIRLRDIYNLNLSADLVVLSACDMGIGNDIKGQGLMSLTNGFLQVGAKSVVSSLWKVDDYATLELMNNFYQILASEKITPSQALRKAQIKMRENPRYQSPYYWAAFTSQGDYQNIPNISRVNNYSKYLLILLSIFTLIGFYYAFKFIKPRLEIKM